ncbi:MAG: transcription initiation factor IIB [Candidatus Bathyarchaeia archaeon]
MRENRVGLEAGRERCPECGGSVIIHNAETGEQICGSCGLVISEHALDRGPEWRAFTLEEKADRSRVGGPISILQADKGLPTVIDDINKDASGRRIPLSTRLQMLRLRKWQSRTQYQSPVERNLLQALSELDRIVDKLHIPEDIQEEAAEIYRRVLDKGLVRGRSIAAIVAACVYAACRKTNRPRSLKEIASVSRVKLKDIARCYRLILHELPMSMPIPDPRIYVTKVASKAGISERAQAKALELLKEADKLKAVTGKDPIGIAAAALYVACVLLGEKKTQKEVAEAAAVTEVTVRNRYKGLREILGLNI